MDIKNQEPMETQSIAVSNGNKTKLGQEGTTDWLTPKEKRGRGLGEESHTVKGDYRHIRSSRRVWIESLFGFVQLGFPFSRPCFEFK